MCEFTLIISVKTRSVSAKPTKSYMAKSGYGPYLLPSVSVSKSRMRVYLGQDLCVEFCICILLFTHLNKNACGVYFALCVCILFLYLVFGAAVYVGFLLTFTTTELPTHVRN